MLLCCCRGKDDPRASDSENVTSDVEQQNKEAERGISQSLSQMLYNRIGRVEKFKHGSTILFLGKAFVMSTLIILLVQYISQTEVCYLDSGLGELPDDVQKMLLDPKAHLLSYRCPYDENFDVAYTFDLVPQDNVNDSFPHQHNVENVNVTAIKVNIADIMPNKIRTDYRSGGEEVRQRTWTAKELCGKMCSIRSCTCFTKMVLSQNCYIDTYEFGLQIDEIEGDGPKRGIFSIYFVFFALFLAFLVLFFSVYKCVNTMWGGKRAGTANIG